MPWTPRNCLETYKLYQKWVWGLGFRVRGRGSGIKQINNNYLRKHNHVILMAINWPSKPTLALLNTWACQGHSNTMAIYSNVRCNLMRPFSSDICRIFVESRALFSRPCCPNPRPCDRSHCIRLEILCYFNVVTSPELPCGGPTCTQNESLSMCCRIYRTFVESLSKMCRIFAEYVESLSNISNMCRKEFLSKQSVHETPCVA